MSRPCVLALLVALGLGLLSGTGVRPVSAAPDLEATQRAYLRTRDAARLLTDLRAQTGSLPAGLLDLARWAAGREAALEGEEGMGPVSDLARVVGSLRRFELAEARAALKEVDPRRVQALAWCDALLRLRVGDDDAAVSRLLAPPLFDWNRDAFLLALTGAALLPEDRRLLAAGAIGALERAAARNRASAVESLALALAALDGEAGREALAFALRVLRRSGRPEAATALWDEAGRLEIDRGAPRLRMEAALTAWELGTWEQIPTLLEAGAAPAGARAAYLALRHAQRRGRTLALPRQAGHARGEPKHALLLAQLATALGRATTLADVQAWSERHKTKASHAASARGFLTSLGFDVVTTVGDAAAGDALLEAGLPFLLFRIQRTESGYRESPVLVRGFDRKTGLWILVEPDGHRVDVTPRADVAKARIVAAVPPDRRALLDPVRPMAAARAGAQIEAAIDELDRGRHAEAVARLPEAGATDAVAQVYRAYGLHRAANLERKHAWLVASQDAVNRSRQMPPLLGLEAYVRGQALGVAGRTEEAIAVFDTVVRLEGPSATVEMARFAALDVAKDQAGALAAVTAAQRLAPLDSRILFYRASVRGRGGDLEGARHDLRRALERQPDGLRIALALARLEVMAGRPERALDVLRETERRNPAAKEDPALRLERRAAEFALLEDARSVEDLSFARRSEEPETRRRLAYELAQRESEAETAEPMLRLLLADPEAEVRITALRVYLRPWLRERIEADSILSRRITDLLGQDPEADVRRAAATLMGRISCTIACRALAASLYGEAADPDPLVRRAVAQALAPHEKGRSARVALVAALEDESQEVRQAAIDVLFQATATTHGFEDYGEEADRAAAVALWKAWLES